MRSPAHLSVTLHFNAPHLFLDIGANYGFSSLLHFVLNPSCRFVAVEPNPSLVPFIQVNLQRAGCHHFTVLNAIASSTNSDAATFAINPGYSQDSRVVGPPGWRQVTVPAVTIDQLTADVPQDTFVYVKVDTQGYEQFVLAGAHGFLTRSSSWILKIEFAPTWQQSQGTDPLLFLKGLVEAYYVCEIPARATFKTGTLAYILRGSLALADCESFTAYIQGLAKGGGGYCDLLVLPKTSSILAETTSINLTERSGYPN